MEDDRTPSEDIPALSTEGIMKAIKAAKRVQHSIEPLGYVGSHKKLPPGRYERHRVDFILRISGE